jgi:uncharacterized NAD(P)/FAD-binding protein YdhS
MTSTVAIIGGGVSGAFVVLNCLRQATAPLKILWFDSAGLFCKGLAYSTCEEVHLLNVRASNMSAFADEPAHFVNWIKANAYSYEGKDFVPRSIYGRYVMKTLEDLQALHSFVEVVPKTEEVVAVARQEHGFTVTAQEEHRVDKVVLAIGNFLPAHPRSVSKEFRTSPHYFQNAFNSDALDKVAASDSVTIVGAGLTMIDVVLALVDRNYKGKICIISPHGYLPQAHIENIPAINPIIDPQRTYTLLELYGLVKQQLRKARTEALSPYAVIDALRPHLQRLWLSFSTEDQLRFLRHLRHKWGVARHRAPSESIHTVQKLIDEGTLTVWKGRIFDIEEAMNGFELHYKNDKGIDHTIQSRTIVNCTGPESDFNKVDSVLVKRLISSGLMEGHNLSYGIKASKTGELLPGFFTIGPPLKGVLWESTAVPEIRTQAASLAGKIIFD